MGSLELYVKVGHLFLKGVFYPSTLDSVILFVPKKNATFFHIYEGFCFVVRT